MKRPYKIIRILTVAVAICLLTVDPASACRLLGNRRCCCCVCSPGKEMSCTLAVPGKDAGEQKPAEAAETLPSEPSPSDAPPDARTGSGTLTPNQLPLPNNDRSQTVPARNSTPEPAAIRSTATLTFGEPQLPSPANLDRPASEPSVIHEPAAGPLGVAPGPRDPALIDPTAADQVETPPVGISNTPVDSSAAAAAPSTIDVSPQTNREPIAPAATAQRTDIQRPLAEPVPQATVKRPTEGPLTAAPSPMRPGGRSPAAALPTPSRTAVDAPGFPPAADDPFAPMPKKPQPAEDDPFVPLPQVKQPSSEPAAPLAAEPTNLKTADALTLGSDGRLPVREWRDTSGQFRIKAKLLLILDGKVRLLKDTGRTTTVALERLSEQDRAYINEVVARYGNDLTTLDQLAAR
jgi:hypothetical protein